MDGGNRDSAHTDSTDPDVKAEKGKQDEDCFGFH